MSKADITDFLGPDTTYASFAAATAEADAVWYYKDPFTEALIAVRGCTVLSEMTLVIREMY